MNLDQYLEVFKAHVETETFDLKVIDGGFHLKSLEPDRCVHVMRMLFNWRLSEWYGPCDTISSGCFRYWCYSGLGVETFLKAVGEGFMWDGTDEKPPTGWIKNHKGEYALARD